MFALGAVQLEAVGWIDEGGAIKINLDTYIIERHYALP